MHPLRSSRGHALPVQAFAAAALAALLFPLSSSAQTPSGDSEWLRLEEYSDQEMERRIAETRTDFLSRLDGIPVGRSDRARRQDFRADLRLFRRLVIEFWTLRFAPMSEEWAREDLWERAGELAGILERMREHVNRGSDPDPGEPVPLAGRTFPEQIDQFFLVGSRLPARAAAVTEGAVLDFGLLVELRQDFRTLESWTEAFRQSTP